MVFKVTWIVDSMKISSFYLVPLINHSALDGCVNKFADNSRLTCCEESTQVFMLCISL
jgi:hypothetical protein